MMRNYQNLSKEELIVALEKLQQLNSLLVSPDKKKEKKHADKEQKLQKRDLLFRKLSANVPDLIFQFTRRTDGSYCVPIASKGIINIFGCAPEDVLNDFAPIAKVIYPEDAERVMSDIEYSATHLTSFTCEFRVQLPGKEIQWILSKSTPEKLPDGSVTWYGFNANITEQKKTEEILANEKRRLSDILKGTNIGTWEWNVQTGETTYNERWAEIIGYTLAEISPISIDTWATYWHPDDLKNSNDLLEKHFKGELAYYECEGRMKHKQGHWIWVLDKGRVHSRDKDGKPLFMSGTHQDITERKQAEADRKKFEMITDSSSEFIGMCDLQLQPVYVNPSGIKLMGLPDLAEACRVKVQDYFFPEDQRFMVEEFFPRVLREGEGDVEIRLRHFQTGGAIWMLYNLFKVCDDNGIPIGWATVSRDITERKQAAEKLRESEYRYRKIYEDGANGMVMVGKEFKFLMANRTFCQMVGYLEEELQQLTFADITHPDDNAKDIPHIKKMIAGEIDMYTTEKRYVHKNGETIWAQITISPFYDTNGQFLYNLGMIINVTDRKKAEEILKESYTLIKIAGEIAKLGGWIVNLEDNRSYWSNEVAAIHEMPFGYSPLVNEGMQFYAPKWRDKITEVFGKCALEGISYDEEMEIITATGKMVWVRTIGEAVRDEHGNIVKVQGAFQDISDRKRAEASLRQSEENLAITLNSIGDGVIATDLEGLVVNMNPIAEKLCGWSLSEAVGKPLTEVFRIVNARSRETMINPVKKVLENGDIVGLANHTVLISKDGTEYQISDSAAPIKNKEGKISGIVLVFSDVTEKYLTAQSLIENEERLNLFFNQSLTGFFFMMNDAPVVWNDSVDKEKTLDVVFSSQRVTKVNQAMLDQYKATEGDLMNRTLYDFFAHDLKQGRRVIRNLFDRGSLQIDTSELRFDGTQMWVEGYYICLYDSNGDIKGLFGTQQDISNRKNALIEIQQSKKELEEYFENDISADYILSVDGYVLSCNNTFLKLFGLDKKPEPGTLNIINFYKHPEQRKLLVSRINAERKIENYSADFITVDGKEINAILNAIGIFDENDQLIKIRGYIVDITKQIKAEAATKLNDTALKVISQGVVITDENRRIISSNASFKTITGYSDSEIIGRSCKFLQGPLSNPQTIKAINEALAQHTAFVGDILNYRKDGTLFWNELTITPIFNNDGALTHFIGVTRDITERKQDEVQLRNLSRAVEQSPASVILTDTQGNIEYVNPKTLKVTGYELSELLGKNPKIFSSGEKPKEEYKALWNNITSGKEWQGEFHNKRKNGELYWEQATISPILNKEEEIIHYLAVKEDITERKQILQDLIIAKEQAEQSDKLKSAFLANMSHEIRTPMNGILGFTELLKEPDLSNEKQQKFISIIQKSGDRLLNIINDIVDISKIEAGLLEANITALNLKEQIDYIHTFFKPEIEKKGLQFFIKDSFLEEDLIIETDPEKIYAIFTNLIKNALKFTHKGFIVFGYERKEEYLEFYVKDTGIGIPKDKHEAIFERFIQADISDKMAFQGSGLGLSITKAYVELLGGKIWVESEPENVTRGKAGGSTFYFTIPCKTGSPMKIKSKKAEAADNSGKKEGALKILIAEDDEASSLYLAILVETFSSEILMAKNGHEAVEIYKNNPDIDLIFMDMQMPHLNGYEATRQIRQINKKVVIIAQTAFALSFDKQKVIDAGCSDYISKPIIINDLQTLIRSYFK